MTEQFLILVTFSLFQLTLTKLSTSYVAILENDYFQYFIPDLKLLAMSSLQDVLSLTSTEAFVSYPTTCGLPMFYSLMDPDLIKMKVTPTLNGLSATGVVSSRTQEKLGVIDNFNKQEIVTGLDMNLQVYLPSISVDIGPRMINFSLAEPKKNHRLLHVSSWPYSAKREIFYLSPSGEDPEVIPIRKVPATLRKKTFESEAVRDITGISIQQTTRSEDLDGDIQKLPNFDDTLHHSITNVWYNGTLSSTESISFSFEAGKSLARLWEIKSTSNPDFFKEAGMQGHLWSYATRAQAKFRFNGSPSREYSAELDSAFVQSGTVMFSVLLQKAIDDEISYEICSDIAVIPPETEEHLTKMFTAVEYGQTCLEGSNLTITVLTDMNYRSISDLDPQALKTTIVHEKTPDVVQDFLCQVTDETVTFKPELKCEDPVSS